MAPVIEALEPGEPPDLGSLLGDDDTPLGSLLKELAFVEAPLGEGAEVVRKVQAEALDGRIKELRRIVERLDPDGEPEEYAERFEELIALEKESRELWSPE